MRSDALIPAERIERAIYLIRGQKVMLDRDLAVLYEVETKRLKEQVRRNIDRFPEDFMFVLTTEEFANWRSQFVTSNSDRMGLRYAPMAFTELGVVMLSSVVNTFLALETRTSALWCSRRGSRRLTLDRAVEYPTPNRDHAASSAEDRLKAELQT